MGALTNKPTTMDTQVNCAVTPAQYTGQSHSRWPRSFEVTKVTAQLQSAQKTRRRYPYVDQLN